MKHTPAALMVLGLLYMGCEDERKPPATVEVSRQAVPAAAMGTPQVRQAQRSEPPTVSHVVVDRRITDACHMTTPYFDFDSAAVHTDPALNALATCFTTGPLKAYGLKLVGHADPRGDNDYNLALGQRRAGGVEIFLSQHGMEKERIGTSSRGELDAVGMDDAGWAIDRRVDILLGEPFHD